MSISSRITEIEQHITNAYDGLEDIGADLTNIDKNINNISTVLDNIWNDLPKVTATDVEEASLDGTKKGRMQLDLKGNIDQEQLEGYNVLNLEKYFYNYSSSNLNGGTVTIKDGVITVDGTNATDTVTARSEIMYNENRDILSAGTYYFGVRCNLRSVANNEFKQVLEGVQTLGEDYYLSQWYFPCAVGNIRTAPLLISKDTSKTSYEPYCGGIPAPNPSYEIPVRKVTGNANVKIQNKNLIQLKDGTYTSSSQNLIVENGIASFEGSVGSGGLGFYIPLEKSVTLSNGETNTFSVNIEGTVPNYRIAIRLLKTNYETDANSFGRTFGGVVNNKATITATQEDDETYTYAFLFIIADTSNLNFKAYYQLEQGSTATSYVEHQEQNLPLDLRSKNLFDKDNVVQGYLKTDGTIQSTSQFRVSDYIDVSNYSNMVVSGNSGGSEVNCFYDNEKSLIRAVSTGSSTVYAMEVPSNAKYIRVTVRASVLDNYQLEQGTEATDYVPYYNYELSKIEDAEDTIKKSTGKNLFLQQNITANNNENAITLEKTLEAGTYTFGAELTGTTSSTATTYGCTVVIYNGSTRLLDFQLIPNNGRKVHQFTANSSFNKITFRPGYSTGDNGKNYIMTYSNIELDSGNTDGLYEPYGKVWYLNKEVGKVVLDGSNDEEITLVGSLNTDTTYFNYYNPIFEHTAASIFPTGKSNYLLPNYANALFKDNINGFTFSAAGNLRFALQNLIASTIAEAKIWLSTHNLIVYGKLETPTKIEITETPLINQLEAIRKAQSYNDQTNINQTNEDLPFILNIEALKK